LMMRIGQPPKRAFLFRADQPFDKIFIELVAPNAKPGAKTERIEFLGDGQQIVWAGIHPDTKKPYSCHGGELGQITRADLPCIHEAEARELVEDIVQLLVREHGYQRKSKAKKTGNGKDSGEHKPTGPDPPELTDPDRSRGDWGGLALNIHKGVALHDSLRDLAAKLIAAGTQPGAAARSDGCFHRGAQRTFSRAVERDPAIG
jgi:hypothetical protein